MYINSQIRLINSLLYSLIVDKQERVIIVFEQGISALLIVRKKLKIVLLINKSCPLIVQKITNIYKLLL